MIGRSLTHYEIIAPLGRGGMGEVYRARDTRLGRDVAVKILPDDWASRPESRARFDREAKLLASLNHPGIAAVYDLDEIDGTSFLVMELVEGGTLSERMSDRSLSMAEALDVAHQIAASLEVTHARGIVHRDLKPSNIGLTSEGRVKLLDFGLARGGGGHASLAGTADAPTMPMTLTQADAMIGTPTYMSPEQALGEITDARTDVWAFGAVLYEMLARARAFGGDTVSDTIARILEHDPDFDRLPADTPAAVRVLIRRCLVKDRQMRLQSIGDARVVLQECLEGTAPEVAALPDDDSRSFLRSILPYVLLPVVAVLAWWSRPPTDAPSGQPLHFEIVLPDPIDPSAYGRTLALSPDGNVLAFIAATLDSAGHVERRSIYVRRLDEDAAIRLAEFDSSSAESRRPWEITFSPDGQWLLVVDHQRGMYKIPVQGGSPVVLDERVIENGVTWGENGTIVFVYDGRLWQIPESGGTPRVLLDVRAERERLGHPHVLPGARQLLFTARPGSYLDWDSVRIDLLDLESGETTTLLENAADARYVETGHLLFARGTRLMAIRFDPRRLRTTGDPVAVTGDIRRSTGVSGERYETGTLQVSVSRHGRLAYVPGSSHPGWRARLVWVDRNGNEQEIAVRAGSWLTARISPDGRRCLLSEAMGRVWTYDFEREVLRRQLITIMTPGLVEWWESGRRFAFAGWMDGGRGLFTEDVDAEPNSSVERLIDREAVPMARVPSRDTILVNEFADDGWRLASCSATGEVREILPYHVRWVDASPDGKWIVYGANEAGTGYRAFARSLDGPQPAIQVSPDYARDPHWSADGSEIFYCTYRGDRAVMNAVPVSYGDDQLSIGSARELFSWALPDLRVVPATSWDVAPDGRFLMFRLVPDHPDVLAWQRGADRVRVIDGWFVELRETFGED